MNLGTARILLLLVSVIALSVYAIYRDKKKGKAACGGDCSRCRGCSHFE